MPQMMPRFHNKSYEIWGFSPLKTPENKYKAVCRECNREIANTSESRLRSHRKICPSSEYATPGPANITKPKRKRIVTVVSKSDDDSLFESKEETIVYDSKIKETDENIHSEAIDIVDVSASFTRDEFIAFGNYITAQLRKLDSRTSAIVKYKICELLYNAEIGNFKEGNVDVTGENVDIIIRDVE